VILPCGEASAPRHGILRYTSFTTSIGRVLVTRTDAGLRALAFAKDLDVESELAALTRRGRTIAVEDAIGLRRTADAVREFLRGKPVRFEGRLDLANATAFTSRVLEVVRAIPFGKLRSYKWVAKEAGSPRAARAVGQVLARNPLPIVVPCHRVVESDGTLGGYSCGGPDMKRRLIELENGQLGLEFAETEREARERVRFLLESEGDRGEG
jgi:methylated-DNA-[protein]-cysteine S-methyltransferase